MKSLYIQLIIAVLFLTHTDARANTNPKDLIKAASECTPNDLNKADSLATLALTSIQSMSPQNDSLEASVYYLIGTIQLYKARYRVSCHFFEKMLALPLVQQSKILRREGLNNLAGSLKFLGKIPEAMEAIYEAMKISKEINDESYNDFFLPNVAEMEYELGDYGRAINFSKQALLSAEQKSDTESQAICHLNLGKYYIAQKEMNTGGYHSGIAIRLFEQLGDWYNLTSVLLNQSRIEQFYKQYDASNRLLFKVIEIARKNNLEQKLTPSYIQLAENILLSNSDPEKAREYLLEALRLSELAGRRDYMEEATLGMSKYYTKVGDFNNFLKTMEKYEEVRRETAAMNAKSASEELKTIYDMEQLVNRNTELQQDIKFKNSQLWLVSIAFLVAIIFGGIIFWQYRKLKRNTDTMFQMNVNLAYSTGISAPETESETVPVLSEENGTSSSDIELYKYILKKIEQKELHKDTSLTINELSRQIRRNKSSVSKAIKEIGKTNFAGLINEFRINEARKLIMENGTSMTINEIASAAGYSSRTSFNRNFKESTGFTPSEYLMRYHGTTAPDDEDAA